MIRRLQEHGLRARRPYVGMVIGEGAFDEIGPTITDEVFWGIRMAPCGIQGRIAIQTVPRRWPPARIQTYRRTLRSMQRQSSGPAIFPESTDMNPIEHLWNHLDRKVYLRNPPPQNLAHDRRWLKSGTAILSFASIV